MASSLSINIIDGLIHKINKHCTDCSAKQGDDDDIPASKHFYQNIDRLVFDAIDGELYSNPNLTRLYTSDPSIKVVYRADWNKTNTSKVALISGGGSGHEPCFFGYLGKGMLTAAVCGEIFASPTTKAIIYGILAVANKDAGALLLVTNYTGDVLNFTLAANIVSTSYHIPCKILLLSDDISIPRANIPNIGKRGLAGGVFVHKIAGYLSEEGYNLNDITSICSKYADNIGTVGIAASVCNLIGTPSNMEMDANVLELGYGVHGEAGFETISFDRIANVIPQMMMLFKDYSADRNYLQFMHDKNLRAVIMLNNLGGVTNIEMSVIKKYLMEYIYNGRLVENIVIERVFMGQFETSLNMKGFSISIMKVDDMALNALDFEVDAKSWKKGELFQANALQKSISQHVEEKEILNISIFGDEDNYKTELNDDAANVLRLCIESASKSIIEHKDILNELDQICGDGDCGTTLQFGAKLLLKNMDKFHYESLSLTLCEIAQLLSDMGGSSGALYGFLFISASKQVSKISKLNVINVCKAFKKAILQFSEYSRAKEGDRTMLDALIPSIDRLLHVYDGDDDNYKNALHQCANTANIACDKTQQMTAKFGRSSYVAPQIQQKCVDAGAKAVAIWINSVVNILLHQ